ncbi:L-aspartate oxidase [Dorea sp. D27]|uniref:L-aspartate oxidase n=1 Tax=Dorea sp. D27 TaxID=658665 RepID=UPI0006733978|nr:L-aspartate oxidase [Dorea sp. D27]KMZ52801.1 L-aspartate oxidase [Dorea sp. D27]
MVEAYYDVIIVGTGAAGLFTGLSLPGHLRILMITKDEVESSDSYLAQGGICVLRSKEDYECYFEDTMRAGHYENNTESVRIMIQESPGIIDSLISYGVEFERDGEALAYTKEGAHSVSRILYHKDVTGKEITRKLIACAMKRSNITIAAHTAMADLLIQDKRCAGIVMRKPDGSIQPVSSKAVYLATGGIGGLFANSTNFRHITGDGLALALRHGIELENVHYIQIHPTALYSHREGRRFLISESVRGEGAILLNPDGQRFVDELQPRDLVTEAIRQEMDRFHSPCVYLSLAHMQKDKILYRFPNIYERCLEEGYDLSEDRIPITPAQHYLMGGIRTDSFARTSLGNLFAVGEAGCNGVHGANRLASNSLLESLVFARRSAGLLASSIGSISPPPVPASIDVSAYADSQARSRENKALILNEIKRKDREFYDKWCNAED